MALARALVALVAVLALSQAVCATPDQEFTKIVAYLSRQHPTLVKLLMDNKLVGAVETAVKSGTNLTIVAPSENAFRIFSPGCKVDLPDVLKNHVVPMYLPASAVVSAPQGTKVATLGSKMLWKLKDIPLRVGHFENGKITASAKVVWADAYKTSQIIVHRINRVLASCA